MILERYHNEVVDSLSMARARLEASIEQKLTFSNEPEVLGKDQGFKGQLKKALKRQVMIRSNDN